MVDDTYYITPHEAALAVVATSMKKSRLPFHILVINSIIGGFLFSSGGMMYIMCEAGSSALIPGSEMFVWIAQGSVFAIGLFYVIVCGMELFNSNILFFSTGVMRGAVTLMDLIISWFVSFWVNLASTIFVAYVICHESGIMKQEMYVNASVSLAQAKDTYSFAENILKGVAGNFFVCLAVYLQIMVKPLHVKLVVIYLPIFTFVSMGFTHCVADMFLLAAGILNNCGFGFGHYFWKIMLPGTIGNIIGGSFFGIVIPWYLHLYVIESDMKKLNLPAYEERDEQPMLNMDSRVIRVPTHISTASSSSASIMEFKPNNEMDLSHIPSTSTGRASTLSKVSTSMSLRSRNKPIRSPRGVFPVVDMGQPLKKEKTIAAAYDSEANIDNMIEDVGSAAGDNDDEERYDSEAASSDSELDEDEGISIYSGTTQKDRGYRTNKYDPDTDKVSSRLKRALTRTITRKTSQDLEKGKDGDFKKVEGDNNLLKNLTKRATRIEGSIESEITEKLKAPEKAKTKERKRPTISKSQNVNFDPQSPDVPLTKSESARRASLSLQNPGSKISNKLFKQFTFGGGGDNTDEIHRRLYEAKITKRAAALSSDVAGIHMDTVDKSIRPKSKRSISIPRKHSDSSSTYIKDSKLGGPYASDRWKYFTYDHDLDGELPVSFISEHNEEEEEEEEDVDEEEEEEEEEDSKDRLKTN